MSKKHKEFQKYYQCFAAILFFLSLKINSKLCFTKREREREKNYFFFYFLSASFFLLFHLNFTLLFCNALQQFHSLDLEIMIFCVVFFIIFFFWFFVVLSLLVYIKCSRLGSYYSLAIWTLTHSSCTNITQNIMITWY